MKMALIMFDDRAIGKPIAPATNTGSSQTWNKHMLETQQYVLGGQLLAY